MTTEEREPAAKELHPDDQQIEAIRTDLAKPLQDRQRAYPWDAVWALLECHDQWRENCHRAAAQRNAAYSELDSARVDERVLRDLVAENQQLRAEVERYRGLDAAAKELLARNVELGTSADNAEAKCEDLEDEAARLREQLAEATTLLGHFVDHEDDPCSFDHHGACNQHGGSGLRPCDVAAGRELLARIRGGDSETEVEAS